MAWYVKLVCNKSIKLTTKKSWSNSTAAKFGTFGSDNSNLFWRLLLFAYVFIPNFGILRIVKITLCSYLHELVLSLATKVGNFGLEVVDHFTAHELFLYGGRVRGQIVSGWRSSTHPVGKTGTCYCLRLQSTAAYYGHPARSFRSEEVNFFTAALDCSRVGVTIFSPVPVLFFFVLFANRDFPSTGKNTP